jgi:hypothetical protein
MAHHPSAAEGDGRLRHVERNERALRRPGHLHVGDRRQARLRRQVAEGLVEQLAERCRIDVADHGDLQRILGEHAAGVILEVGDGDLGHALQRAGARPAVRMVAKGDLEEFAARDRVGVDGVALQPGDDLGADALDVDVGEMRRGQRAVQQREGLVLVVLEHAQRAAEMIPRHRKAQVDGAAVEPFMEAARVEIGGAFVQRVGDEITDTGLVGGVLRCTALEGIFHRDHRHGGILHEPGFDAAGRDQMLDPGRGARGCGKGQRCGERKNQRRAAGELEMDHERFSSRLAAAVSLVSLIR